MSKEKQKFSASYARDGCTDGLTPGTVASLHTSFHAFCVATGALARARMEYGDIARGPGDGLTFPSRRV